MVRSSGVQILSVYMVVLSNTDSSSVKKLLSNIYQNFSQKSVINENIHHPTCFFSISYCYVGHV